MQPLPPQKPKHICEKFSSCGKRKSIRWYHRSKSRIIKENLKKQYERWLKDNFKIALDDCLCGASDTKIEQAYRDAQKVQREKNEKGSAPRKRKADDELCFLCPHHAEVHTNISDQTDLFQTKFNTSIDPCTTKVYLCSDHYSAWKQKPSISCSKCQNKIHGFYQKRPTSKILSLMPSLTENDPLCDSCYHKLSWLPPPPTADSESVPQTCSGSQESSEDQTSCNTDEMLTEKIKQLHDKLMNFDHESADPEFFLMFKVSIYVCENLASKSLVQMKDVMLEFEKQASDLPQCSSATVTLNMTVSVMKKKLGDILPGLVQFISSRQHETLLVQEGCDIFSIFQKTLAENEKLKAELQKHIEQQQTSLSFTEHVDKSKCSLEELALVLREKSDAVNANMTNMASTCDWVNINLEDILQEVDKDLFNFLFILLASKSELSEYKQCKTAGCYTKFKNDTSYPKHVKFLRILFLISQLVFIKSDGNTSFPFHSLLYDSGSSSKTVELLNRFCVVSSLDKCNRNICKKLKQRSDIDWLIDFIPSGFAYASVDNIDIDQPFARVSEIHKARGLHMTSIQAVQPRPYSIKNNIQDLVPGCKGVFPNKLPRYTTEFRGIPLFSRFSVFSAGRRRSGNLITALSRNPRQLRKRTVETFAFLS